MYIYCISWKISLQPKYRCNMVQKLKSDFNVDFNFKKEKKSRQVVFLRQKRPYWSFLS